MNPRTRANNWNQPSLTSLTSTDGPFSHLKLRRAPAYPHNWRRSPDRPDRSPRDWKGGNGKVGVDKNSFFLLHLGLPLRCIAGDLGEFTMTTDIHDFGVHFRWAPAPVLYASTTFDTTTPYNNYYSYSPITPCTPDGSATGGRVGMQAVVPAKLGSKPWSRSWMDGSLRA